MKAKKIIIQIKRFLFLLLLFIASCQKENFEIPKNDVNENNVSISLAKNIAGNFSKSDIFYGGHQYKFKTTSINKEIDSIFTISGNNEIALYIITFKPTGFIVVPATKKEEPILAFSESGGFSLSDLPMGLQIWIDCRKSRVIELKKSVINVPSAIQDEWEKYVDAPDYTDPETGDPDPVTNPNAGNYTIQKNPLLHTTWWQGTGFNSLLLPVFGELPPTGCVAVAMAQVMKYHQFPKTYNWPLMPNTYAFSETARLMKDIGKAVNMSYGLDGSGADVEKEVAQSFIYDFGYSTSTKFINDYLSNYNKVVNEIDAGRPVIFRGGTKKYWAGLIPYYADGHAWVADGYYKASIDGYGYLRFHMNWGWYKGLYNGWFSFNNFNPGTNSFNYKVGIVVGIKP